MAEHLLPLSLQDLCLLKVINDLDSYPVELLSSLPHWVRYRLLNNLPVLDLCRLEHTRVARGVNAEEIWGSLAVPTIFYDENEPNIPAYVKRDELRSRMTGARREYRGADWPPPFFLEPHSLKHVDEFITRPIDIPDLDPGLAAIYQMIAKCIYSDVVYKYGKIPTVKGARELCLVKAAFHL